MNVASLDAEKVKKGAEVAAKDNCLACHMLHGERRPSSTEENGAPDLANVTRRYRPDGVRVWLEDPQKAMPGTKMPGFFYTENDDTGKLEPLQPDSAEQLEAVKTWLFSLGGNRPLAAAEPAPKHK